MMTGCFKQDDFEDITIYTTIYPVEYITNYLYGDYSTITSIYPDGVNTNTYELTNKQIKDYSAMNLYIFNGNDDKEANYVTSIFKYNKNLKIIDATNTMEYNYSDKELWLDPSNFLMIALNIKNGILEYTTNHYLNETIENNYNNLKIEISKIDANLKLIYENANDTTIVVDDSSFKFLEKYGFTVISLEENDELNDKTILEVKNLIKSGEISYIFTTNADKLNNTVTNIKKQTNVDIVELNTIDNLTDEQRKNKEDYISLLNENIDLLKNELYN
jgi:zinc transport system substrate-binding protein